MATCIWTSFWLGKCYCTMWWPHFVLRTYVCFLNFMNMELVYVVSVCHSLWLHSIWIGLPVWGISLSMVLHLPKMVVVNSASWLINFSTIIKAPKSQGLTTNIFSFMSSAAGGLPGLWSTGLLIQDPSWRRSSSLGPVFTVAEGKYEEVVQACLINLL